jgi:uncharacterized phage infection (PIP) family protein YhgE
MRGMGALLAMYGGAGEKEEKDYQDSKAAYMNAYEQYKAAKDAKAKEDYRLMMEKAKATMDAAKARMGALLKGVSDAASKAAEHLSNGAKALGSKLSSGIKSGWSKLSSGMKSLGSRLSEGAKSLGSKISAGVQGIKQSIADAKERSDRQKYEQLHAKYGSAPSSPTSTESSA